MFIRDFNARNTIWLCGDKNNSERLEIHELSSYSRPGIGQCLNR